jgi:dihydrolipoamide dehydrogenase
MKEYDVLVIGSGCGSVIADAAMAQGLSVALVDKGPYGGTCLNLGCIPSKVLVFAADRVTEIQESKKLGIDAEIKNTDFAAIMERMRKGRRETQGPLKEQVKKLQDLDFYEGEGHFVSDYTVEVSGERLKGEKVFIASGSRPLIPPIKGLDSVDYLTNEEILELTERPQSMVMIGGGYVAVEFGHFFAAMGTEVTILEMMDRLVQSEEPEISALLERELGKRMAIHTGTTAEEVRRIDGGAIVVAKDTTTGKLREVKAERVLLAVGRRSNADILKVENTGVEVDERGFIKVNEFMETSKRNIYAPGDANGKHMFLHVANKEAEVAWHNAYNKKKVAMDYGAIPHAVYSHPQIAAVGMTEAHAAEHYHIAVGRVKYSDTAKGEAMMEENGFAKAIVDHHTNAILGFHIVGPYAPILVQEVINDMATGANSRGIMEGLHIHPALPELVQRTLESLEEPD